MKSDLLLKLADMLEADAAKADGIKFDMNYVVEFPDLENDEDEIAKLYPVGQPPIAMSCGTSACAMGLAMLSGEFPELSYTVQHDYNLDGSLAAVSVYPTIGGLRTNYDAAAVDVFEIDQHQSHFLFSPAYYSDDQPTTGAEGERFVAQRIRDFVAFNVETAKANVG